MKRSFKKFYPKDMTFCMFGDECNKICPRKISDYEVKMIDYECSWADFRGTEECENRIRGFSKAVTNVNI